MTSISALALKATLQPLPCISLAVILLAPNVSEACCEGKTSFKAVVNVQMTYRWKPRVSLGAEDRPAGFTPLLCVAHGSDYSLWALGKPAPPGIKPLLLYFRCKKNSSTRYWRSRRTMGPGRGRRAGWRRWTRQGPTESASRLRRRGDATIPFELHCGYLAGTRLVYRI